MALVKAVKKMRGGKKLAKLESKKGEKVGPLAGQIKDLLPPALDLSSLAAPNEDSQDESDDGPPEEVSNQRSVEKAMGTEAPAKKKKPTRRGRKTKSFLEAREAAKAVHAGLEDEVDGEDSVADVDAEESGPEAGNDGGQPVYEDPENRAFLEKIRDDDARKRDKRQKGQRIEKDGFVLAHADTAAGTAGPESARTFLQQELFHDRKRRRGKGDRFDRNMGSPMFSGAHRGQQFAKRKKGSEMAA